MASIVRILALLAIAIIALSLLFFVIDQSNEGTEAQLRSIDGQTSPSVRSQADVDTPNPAAPAERVREAQHSSAREYIDDGNDVLAAPFTGIVGSANIWIERLVPAAIGLLLFGLGGLILANWFPESRSEHTDWRETAS
jgi:hypothetical protein